jgi:hypothetical protein
MMLTIGLVALFAHFVLGLAAGAAVLLRVRLPMTPRLPATFRWPTRDRDRLRFGPPAKRAFQ